MASKALVVLSGGQDSTTALFWAKKNFESVYALTFDYGQRHRNEIHAARHIALEIAKVPWEVLEIPALNKAAPSALTRKDIAVKADGGHQNLPSTFVPGRNLVFGTLAASYAISHDIHEMVLGVCETDFSGYPDCRRKTIDALEEAIELGNDCYFQIHTPLMYLDKKATVEMAQGLGADCWEAVGYSITCYEGLRPGCNKCPSCELRRKGFNAAGHLDPARRM